jgi:tetratricopeptide (TPR) repeat protein
MFTREPRKPGHSSTSLVTATRPTELSPLEAAIMDACNLLHEVRAAGAHARAAEVREQLFDLLDKYDASDAENHPNPAWARANQRALAQSAAGEVEQAIVTERIAVKYSDTPRRREISLGNLADRCLRLGRYEEAIEFFLQAQEAAPHSVPVMLTGAQAMALAGFKDEADAIFRQFLAQPEHLRPGTELVAYLEYEPRLGELAAGLPALAELKARWERIKPRIRASEQTGDRAD